MPTPSRVAGYPTCRGHTIRQQPESTSRLTAWTEMAGFKEKTYRDGKQVLKQGSAELLKAVDAGEVAIFTAAKLSELPRQEQNKSLAGGKSEVAKAVKAATATLGGAKKFRLSTESLRSRPSWGLLSGPGSARAG